MNPFTFLSIASAITGESIDSIIDKNIEPEKNKLRYEQLSVHQRISLKGIISERRERSFLNHKHDNRYYDGLKALWILDRRRFAASIEFLLNN